MTTLADVTAYRSVATKVTAASVRDLHRLVAETDDLDPFDRRDILLASVPRIVDAGATVIGDFAATWAADLFAEAGRRFVPAGLILPDPAAVEGSIRWAVGPAFGEGTGTVRDNLTGMLERFVLDAGRSAVADERGRAAFQRFPSPGCCDYCAMLASRGAVYHDEATGDAGSHDRDQCVVAPVFTTDSWTQAIASRFEDRYTGKVSREEDAAIPL